MLISSIGSSMVWPFMTIYIRQHFDVPLTTVGLILSLNSAAGIATTFLAGPVVDRVGRKGIMVWSLVGSGLVYLTLNLAGSIWLLALLMMLNGGIGPLYRIGSNAMVADLIEPKERPGAYALLRMSNNSGIAIGPAIGGFVAAVSYFWTFLGACIAYLIFAALVLFWVQETLSAEQSHDPRQTMRGGYGPLLRDRPFLAYCAVTTAAIVPSALIMVLLPVYAKEQFGVAESQYGFIMATNAMMVVLFQYYVTQHSKHLPYLPVMAVGALLYGLGAGSVALGQGFWGFWLSMVVLTFGELLLVPTGTTVAANLSPADMRGRYMGIYGLTWAFSTAVGPILGGYLNDHVAPVAIWYGGLAFGLVAAVGFLMLRRWLPAEANDTAI